MIITQFWPDNYIVHFKNIRGEETQFSLIISVMLHKLGDHEIFIVISGNAMQTCPMYLLLYYYMRNVCFQ
jgi:hypothetical protein